MMLTSILGKSSEFFDSLLSMVRIFEFSLPVFFAFVSDICFLPRMYSHISLGIVIAENFLKGKLTF